MAELILGTFKQKLAGLELIPGSGGCFELSLDGDLVYSKLETGEFPNEREMLKLVAERLAADART